jgi:hypothetical protein
LNARGIPGLNGGRWRAPQILSLVKPISMVATSRADWLPRLALIIADIRSAGHLSWIAMARQLNARGVLPLMGGRWNRRKVRDALTKMRRHKINYEPNADTAVATQVPAGEAMRAQQPRGRLSGARSVKAPANAIASRLTRRPSKRHSHGVRKSPRRSGCSCQFGRASAPMMPHLLHHAQSEGRAPGHCQATARRSGRGKARTKRRATAP